MTDSGPSATSATRPRRSPGWAATDLGADTVLDRGDDQSRIVLNPVARVVWDACDGERTLHEIALALEGQLTRAPVDHWVDVTGTIAELQPLGCLDVVADEAEHARAVKIVMGIEDKPYFHWQLPILFESLLGQLPNGWEVIVVVCNDHQPVSERLTHAFETYGVRYFTGVDHPAHHRMDPAVDPHRYAPLNRIEALSVAARNVEDDDLVFLQDTDIFLYGGLDTAIFPRGNAMGDNWLIEKEPFFSHRNGPGGVSLPGLLSALGVEQPFLPGGVSVFLTGEVLRRDDFKLPKDCFRFVHMVYLAGAIIGPSDTWISEMPCFALAATANGVEYELVDAKPFLVDKDEVISPGTFYHYYHDPRDRDGVDGAFHGSPWHKQAYFERDFLETDIGPLYEASRTDHERAFFELALRAQRRLARPSRSLFETVQEAPEGRSAIQVRPPLTSASAIPAANVAALPTTAATSGGAPSAEPTSAVDHEEIVTRRPKKTILSLDDVDPRLRFEWPVGGARRPSRSLRSVDADASRLPEPTRAFLLEIPGGYIGDGVVFDADHYFSFGKWWLGGHDDAWRLYADNREVHEIGPALALGAWCGDQFEYFAADALPRLSMALDWLEAPANRHVQIVTHREHAPAATWFLDRLGLGDRVIQKAPNAAAGFVHRAERAYYVDAYPSAGRIGLHPPGALDALQARLGTADGVERDVVLYLDSEFPAGVRNAESLLPRLEARVEAHGLHLRRLTSEEDFAARLEAVSRARVLIGPHGPHFANLVFARPGTQVVEFTPRASLFRVGAEPRPNYWGLSQAAQLEHWTIEPQNATPNAGGMIVDEREVEVLIDYLLA